MSATSNQVIDLDRAHIAEAAHVLSRAFAADPLMRYLFAERGRDYRSCLRAIFQYQCALQLELQWPLLGIIPRTRIAGVVGIGLPEQPAWPKSVTELQSALTNQMGPQAVERLDRYAARTNGHFPNEPLFYVRMIGVRPESQGQGYARLLLEAVHRRSEAHPKSTGVALDTENAANVEIYKRMGYQVVGQAKVDTITIWCMIRPNQAAQ
jgi:ribosomal protein S18 acetylase RimI-like enzyme